LTEPRHSVLAQHSQVVNNGTCYQVCIVVTSCQLLGIAVTYTPGGSIGSNHRTAVPRPLKCCCTSIKDCRTPDCKQHAPKCSRCCTSSATGISYSISQIHALAYILRSPFDKDTYRHVVMLHTPTVRVAHHAHKPQVAFLPAESWSTTRLEPAALLCCHMADCNLQDQRFYTCELLLGDATLRLHGLVGSGPVTGLLLLDRALLLLRSSAAAAAAAAPAMLLAPLRGLLRANFGTCMHSATPNDMYRRQCHDGFAVRTSSWLLHRHMLSQSTNVHAWASNAHLRHDLPHCTTRLTYLTLT
jgi:hypothetical protein